MRKKLTKRIIHSVQKSWAEGILKISHAYRNNEEYKNIAEEFIYRHYGYEEGLVLFKPTLVSKEQFRETFEKAHSYFVAGNPNFPEDKGFAIQPWKKIKFRNAGIVIIESRAVAMGNYFFSHENGKVIKVEYTFGYFMNKYDEIKIHLHHSSIPYSTG